MSLRLTKLKKAKVVRPVVLCTVIRVGTPMQTLRCNFFPNHRNLFMCGLQFTDLLAITMLCPDWRIPGVKIYRSGSCLVWETLVKQLCEWTWGKNSLVRWVSWANRMLSRPSGCQYGPLLRYPVLISRPFVEDFIDRFFLKKKILELLKN